MGDNLYEQSHKKLAESVKGRRKGQLWRADKEWVAISGFDKDANQVMRELKQAAKQVEEFARTRRDKGWSRTRNHKWIGSIPRSVALANPSLLYDPDEATRFFKDNPKFSADYYHVKR